VALSAIVPGLWRWTAPHPDWKPEVPPGSSEYWEQMVGSVLYELPQTVALIDPLLPIEGREEFERTLDELIAGRPVSVLTTIHWHSRDREQLAERYSANTTRAWNVVPAGVQPRPLRGAGETMFWLPAVATLVAGDRLLGSDDGGVQLCPESWLCDVQVDRAGLAQLMRPLLELPIERLLVSHGEPLLHDGRAALARAIASVEEGSDDG
jgi:hypothetical protein